MHLPAGMPQSAEAAGPGAELVVGEPAARSRARVHRDVGEQPRGAEQEGAQLHSVVRVTAASPPR